MATPMIQLSPQKKPLTTVVAALAPHFDIDTHDRGCHHQHSPLIDYYIVWDSRKKEPLAVVKYYDRPISRQRSVPVNPWFTRVFLLLGPLHTARMAITFNKGYSESSSSLSVAKLDHNSYTQGIT